MLSLNLVMALSQSTANGLSGFFTNFGGYILIFGAFIVIMIVTAIPQRKREKQIRQMMDNLKKGDVVRTIGGICGTVDVVKDDLVTISVGPEKVKLVFVKGAIATVENAEVEKSMDDGITPTDSKK